MDRNENAYTSGPTNPFRGGFATASQEISIYATYKPIPSPPANVAPPHDLGNRAGGTDAQREHRLVV